MKEYYIYVNGQPIVVSCEVYRAYVSMAEHERYLERKDRANGLLTEMPSDECIRCGKISSPVEQQIFRQWQVELLYEAVSLLDEHEKWLVGELYFAEKSQSQLSRETGIPQQTISYRAKQILKKLKNLLNHW